MKKLLCTCMLLTFLALPCMAQVEVNTKPDHEVFGLVFHPHGGLTLSRIDEDWSTGFIMGVELDAGSGLYLDASYTMHDILTDAEKEAVPWDGTFMLTLGAYF